jgi:hypothetical protein
MYLWVDYNIDENYLGKNILNLLNVMPLYNS